jgi:hypothetical protein
MYTLKRNSLYLVNGVFVPLAEANSNKVFMYRYKSMLLQATADIKLPSDEVVTFAL